MKITNLMFLMMAFLLSLSVMAGCAGSDDDTSIDGDMMTDGDDNTDGDMEVSYMDVTAAEAKDLIDNTPDLVIIDVSPLWANGHIPGAVNYPVGDGSLDTAIPMLDSEGKYLVYCHGDAPSILGAQKLIDAGFETVYRLDGNYAAWVDAGYDVETE